MPPMCDILSRFTDIEAAEDDVCEHLARLETDTGMAMLGVIRMLRNHRANNAINGHRLERLTTWLREAHAELVTRKNYEASDMIRTILEREGPL